MLVIAHDKSLESSSISEVSSSLPNLPDDHQRLAGFTFAREQHQVSLIRPVLDLFSDRLGLFRGQRSRHDNISPPTVGRPDRGTTSEERLERRPADGGARPPPRPASRLPRSPSTRTLSPNRRSDPRRRQVRLCLVLLRASSPAKLAHDEQPRFFALHEVILLSIVFPSRQFWPITSGPFVHFLQHRQFPLSNGLCPPFPRNGTAARPAVVFRLGARSTPAPVKPASISADGKRNSINFPQGVLRLIHTPARNFSLQFFPSGQIPSKLRPPDSFAHYIALPPGVTSPPFVPRWTARCAVRTLRSPPPGRVRVGREDAGAGSRPRPRASGGARSPLDAPRRPRSSASPAPVDPSHPSPSSLASDPTDPESSSKGSGSSVRGSYRLAPLRTNGARTLFAFAACLLFPPQAAVVSTGPLGDGAGTCQGVFPACPRPPPAGFEARALPLTPRADIVPPPAPSDGGARVGVRPGPGAATDGRP